MTTSVAKRSSQELRAIRSAPTLLIDVLKPLIPAEDEISETHPRFIAWFVAGREVPNE